MVGTVADCGFARLPCAVSLIIETFAARRKQCRVLMIRCRSWGTGNCEKIGLMITRAHSPARPATSILPSRWLQPCGWLALGFKPSTAAVNHLSHTAVTSARCT